jgi:hypothetical protein
MSKPFSKMTKKELILEIKKRDKYINTLSLLMRDADSSLMKATYEINRIRGVDIPYGT